MRSLIALLFAIPVFAGTVDTSTATCNGSVYQGTDYASCGAPWEVPGAFATAEYQFASAGESGGGSASASFVQDFVFDAWDAYPGGTFSPSVIVGGDLRGGSNTATAGVTISSPLYGTCNLAAWNETCYFPFVSGVPETFAINVWATAEGSADYLGVSAEAVITGFECFDVSGAGPCNFNVPAQPVPESGTYLPTALASAAFIARNRRRSRCSSKADSNRVLHNI